MADTVLADALHDPPVPAPAQRRVPERVIRGVVQATVRAGAGRCRHATEHCSAARHAGGEVRAAEPPELALVGGHVARPLSWWFGWSFKLSRPEPALEGPRASRARVHEALFVFVLDLR
ncbi:hypothetical protein FM112_00855 [Gulosibacter sp. 10]|nr:hypothetical protein FM112_00855 [Gulosibacter sp. 10]